MKVITLLNEKGGVGKTTLSTHLATGIAKRGQRVLLIDTDPQGHATMGLGFEKYPGLYDLLVRSVNWKECMKYAGDGETRLYAIGSNIETRYIGDLLRDTMLLKKRLKELEPVIDVVIIDTSPTPSSLHGIVLLASDYVILPSEVEFYSLQGLIETMAHIEQFADSKRNAGMTQGLDVMGIVPVKYRRNTIVHSESLNNLIDAYGEKVWEPITHRANWPAAQLVGEMVWEYDETHPAADEAWAFVDRVIEAINKIEV